MKNWIELCSDVDWQDYHGMWARKAKDGSWYVLRWTNLYDAIGEKEAPYQYECDVLHVDLAEIDDDKILDAFKCCGFDHAKRNAVGNWIENGDDNTDNLVECVMSDAMVVECLIQYGIYAPLDEFTGNVRPLNIRAQARRRAEELMRDAEALKQRLDRPVNKIGSTAADFGKGDPLAGLRRYAEEGIHGADPNSDLMLKIYGDRIPS